MAKASDKTFELVMIAAIGLGAYVIAKRQVKPPVAYDAYGNPISAAYGVGSLAVPPGQANTIPNIINSFANLFGAQANAATGGGYADGGGPALSAPLPVGPAPDPTAVGALDYTGFY